MRVIFIGFVLLLLAASGLDARAQSRVATYSVQFEATWSASTHPIAFPGNPHFSGLVGAVHDAGVVFWTSGIVASPGMEAMAETGSKTLLLQEVATAPAGSVRTPLSGSGIGRSPGTVSMEFEASDAHPFVTLVSMLAPSPDWFVGVSALSLRDGNGWIPEIQVPLEMWDAGSDSGVTYVSSNNDTQPPGLISKLQTGVFATSGLVGSFTFSLLAATGRESDPRVEPSGVQVYPNPVFGGAAAIRSNGGPLRVRVFDLLGREMVVERSAPAGQITLSTDAWTPGVYLVAYQTRDSAGTKLLVVR